MVGCSFTTIHTYRRKFSGSDLDDWIISTVTHVTVCNLLWLELGAGRRGLINSDLNHETTGINPGVKLQQRLSVPNVCVSLLASSCSAPRPLVLLLSNSSSSSAPPPHSLLLCTSFSHPPPLQLLFLFSSSPPPLLHLFLSGSSSPPPPLSHLLVTSSSLPPPLHLLHCTSNISTKNCLTCFKLCSVFLFLSLL